MYDEQEPREHELAPELAALERQLRGMTPAAPRIDRDRMMFIAGQASGAASVSEPGQHGRAMYDETGRPLYTAGPSWAGRRFWPAATFTMTAATLLLATMLVWQNRSQPFAQQAAPIPAVGEPDSGSHDNDVDQTMRFAARNTWPSIPSINSGYLGIRYIALTRGIGAVPSDFSSDSVDGVMQIDNRRAKPATARGLLDELLPPSDRSIQSRS